MKNKRTKRLLLDISIVLILITAIVCMIMAVISYSEYRRGNDAYLDAADSFLSTGAAEETGRETEAPPPEPAGEPADSAETAAVTSGPAQSGETAAPAAAAETEAPRETAAPPRPVASSRISVDFAALKAVNGDIAAWIISEGTLISYPVAASDTEEDYDYYISHLFNGRKNKLGTLFTDARSVPFTGNNTIVYGHNMLNGTMFSSLLGYRKQSYYDSHPEMRLYTPEGSYRILLFAGYMTTDKSDAYVLNLTGDAFAGYIAKAAANSDFKARFTPSAADKLITLSTCDNQTSDKRYVVHGILVRE